MSMVAMCSLRVSASCKNRDNVRGMMVGLKLVGSGMSALIMERRRVSPRLAFCLSGSPLWPCAAYPVLFPLFALQDCVDLPYALISCVLDVLVADTRVTGIRVFVSWIRPWISFFCIARRNLSRSGAVRASLVSISSVSPMKYDGSNRVSMA